VSSEQNPPGWPDVFLSGWPGRFQHAQLVRRLDGDEIDDDPALCLLAGLSAGRTVDEVLAEFVDRGEFQLAETLLAESDAVSGRVRARLADLESRRAERASELATRLQLLAQEAAAAGVPFEADVTDLEALTRVSWPAAEAILQQHGTRISKAVDRLCADLRTQNSSGHLGPQLQAVVESLIAVGRLTLARHVLEGGISDLRMPEAQPALPPWRWSEPVAEVLAWHVDPLRPKPPEFSAWRAVDNAAQDLVEAADALSSGGPEAAQGFAVALERFLDPDCTEPVVHEFRDGWLSTVTLFRQAPLDSFRSTPGVDLLILPPGVQSPPALPGVENYLAVGPDLQPQGGFRTGAAVLTVTDILRLVTLRDARAIGLARIVGAQWPLSALGVGTPVGLTRLLAQDPSHHSWHLLGWLCNLVGVGGSATAEDLQFQGGDDTPVVYTLLTNLVDARSASPERITARPASSSPFGERGLVGVESVVLRDCPDPQSRAAFWAALLAAPPGTSLDLDSLVIAAALSPVGDDADWEAVLTTGFARLREQWFVTRTSGAELSLRPIGVLGGLRSLAERRLAECARELVHPVLDDAGDGAEIPREWSVYRYALSREWAVYRAETIPGDGSVLITDPAELIEAAAELPGSCDLAEVAEELVAQARRSFPAAEIVTEIPRHVQVAVSERVMLTILYQLLENALEATQRVGKIFLSVRTNDTDVIVDVFDDGPGLDPAIMRTAQVFRPGFSTRGEGRGVGLHLVRRLTDVVRGELEVADRSDGHPVFKGAHFTLILSAGSSS